jgi:RNA polymerase sigma factor (sigma-70 family)
MPNVTPDGAELTPSDAVLIRRFAASADQDAFATLVRRHGPLVMGVCRRLLHNQHHAEDAFQATFLVLAQKAGKVRWRRSLANWLHRVAYGVCLNERRRIARRRETELTMDALIVDESPGARSLAARSLEARSLEARSLETLALREETLVFDEELAQLPERYRSPLVLFYLEGRSRDEVAESLGLTLAAVKTRLERGRRRLRLRLVMRGVALSSAVVLLQQSQQAAAAAVTESLITATTQAGVSFAAGTSVGPATPDHIVSLAEGQISTMTWTTYSTKTVLAITSLVSVVVLAVTLGGQAADKDDPFATTEALEASQTTPAATPEATIVATARPTTFATYKGKTAKQGKQSGGEFTPQLSEQEEEILASLNENTSFDFQDTELREVVAYLSEMHQMKIVLDKTTLEDAGISTDTPVTSTFG